jgi:hypothetical protein
MVAEVRSKSEPAAAGADEKGLNTGRPARKGRAAKAGAAEKTEATTDPATEDPDKS